MVRRNTRKTTRQQERIREAFENERVVEIIPAKSEYTDIKTKKLRVAAYCRVSTFDESQSGSFELQKQTYTQKTNNNPEWKLAGIYADQGASGTTIKKREQFLQMLEDCRAGNIDLIIVKSVSRFARNTVDSLSTVRKLKDAGVEIYFEKENIWTFDAKGELLITITSSLAQEESRSISENVTWGKRKQYERGKVSIPFRNVLGFERGPNGELVVNEEEAKIVRYIFHEFLLGKNANFDPLHPLERNFGKLYYKFLLFDLDHTLLDFDTAEDLALTSLLKEQGVEDIPAYKDYYIPMNKSMWKDLEQKKITKPELVNTRFSRLFAHFGQEKDGVYLSSRYQHYLSQQGQTFAGVQDLLDTLTERGYEIYGATNGITFIQTGRLAQSGIAPYFNQMFISEQLHIQKPDALFYEKIAEQIPGFRKEEAVMIGDSLTADVAGGNNAGIATIWYNPAKLANETSAQPTFEVASYGELLEIL